MTRGLRRGRLGALALGLVLASAAPGDPLPPPPTIAELRAGAGPTRLQFEGTLDGGPSYTATLYSYRVGGLKLHALVATPVAPRPPRGFPVLVANHGRHPDPPRYGIGADGRDRRPGDYYRAVPEIYAAHGYLVVMPDYRGHSSSEGVEFARGFLSSAYFTADVLALLAALGDLPDADADDVYMWGHSLGADVTLRALVAGARVRAASLWSTVGGSLWEQAYYYSRRDRELEVDSSAAGKPGVEQLRRDLAALARPWDPAAAEPLAELPALAVPVILHHALADESTPHHWSLRLAAALYALGKPYEFHAYAGADHFLQGEAQRLAVERDVAFFRARSRGGPR